MHLAVFGASGRTGRHLVEAGREAGHEVTALVRTPAKLDLTRPGWEDVGVVQGDVLDPEAVTAAVSEADAVLVALGAPPRATDRVLTRGTETIIGAMRRVGVQRLVVETSFAIADGARLAGPLGRVAIGLSSAVTAPLWRDKEGQEAAVMASGLDWTLVRPITLTDGPATGSYTAAESPRVRLTSRISRADVAAFMLAEVVSPAWSRRAVRLVA